MGRRCSVRSRSGCGGRLVLRTTGWREQRLRRRSETFGHRSDGGTGHPHEAEPATNHPFVARDGTETRLSAFKGKVVVVNLWATWCAPCLAEMPTLAALSRLYADNPEFVVLPISVDVADQREKAIAFIDSQPPLPFYNDPAFQLPFAFEGKGGMPQTILLDRQGRVRATLTGGADWSGTDAKALVDTLLAEPG